MRYMRMIIVGLFALTLTAFVTSTVMLNYNKDTEKPVITADNQAIHVSVTEGEEGLLKGLKAVDNKDGDITENIFIAKRSSFAENGTCKVKYIVFDSSNNAGSYTRTVTYTDYTSPEFHLNEPLIYKVGQPITILDRLSVSDSIEGDISDKIKIVSSDINKTEPGVYKIGIEVINSLGDDVLLYLPVNIVKSIPDAPDIELSTYMVTVQKGENFDSAQYIKEVVLSDGSKGNIDEISIETNVDTSTEGTYQTVYSYTENDGNTGITSLTVVVTE